MRKRSEPNVSEPLEREIVEAAQAPTNLAWTTGTRARALYELEPSKEELFQALIGLERDVEEEDEDETPDILDFIRRQNR